MAIITQSMTPERAEREIKGMREAGRRIRASKETARAFMIKHGYITKDGKLSKRYGG